jgi:hypothetical protein
LETSALSLKVKLAYGKGFSNLINSTQGTSVFIGGSVSGGHFSVVAGGVHFKYLYLSFIVGNLFQFFFQFYRFYFFQKIVFSFLGSIL